MRQHWEKSEKIRRSCNHHPDWKPPLFRRCRRRIRQRNGVCGM